ncbi:MAG TPA: hypothetical protein DFR83_20055, partial [Deltaproteobacteria bacterium]|nr:hypothetical protein [Deltaproteobacteria bacterium]
MNLVMPAALGLVVLVVPIVVLFLRRPPVPTRAISSLLLARALAHLPQRRRRLPKEEFLPLGLILAALLILLAAVSFRPDGFDRPIVIVLDDSETSPLNDEATAASVFEGIDRLLRARPDAAVTVVGTAPLGIRVDASRDTERVLAAIAPAASPQPGDDPSAWLPLLCADGTTTLLLVGPWSLPESASDCPVVRPELPVSNTNIITAVAASSPTSTGDIWLHVEAVGESSTAVVSHDGTALGTVSLSKATRREGIARVTAPPGRNLTVQLDGLGHATASATLEIPPLTPARTLVRTAHPNGYLATLVRLHPRLQGAVVAPEAQAPAPDTPAGVWDLVLTDSDHPINDTASLVAVFGRAAPELGVPAGPVERMPVLSESTPDHPALQLVSLETLHIERTTTLRAPVDATILATSKRGPVALEHQLPDGRRAVVFGFGLDDSDLALR